MTPNAPTPDRREAVYGAHRGQERGFERDWATALDELRALNTEIDRLTAALHAHVCHPDFTYQATFGATPVPPSAQWGTGWEANPETRSHGSGTKPRLTWWWRRRLDQEQP